MVQEEKRRRSIGLLVVHACAVIGLSVCPAWAQSELAVSWGAASSGLRLGISASAVRPVEGVTFEVLLENVGTDDFVLNLGRMLANGKVMFPDAVRLALTRPDGSWSISTGDTRVWPDEWTTSSSRCAPARGIPSTCAVFACGVARRWRF